MTFKDEVTEFITECMNDKPALKSYLFEDYALPCDSGNFWKPDIVIVDLATSEVKLIGEVKIEGYAFVANPKKPKAHTHMEHMWRAGSRFCDIRSYQVPKYLLFPYLVQRPRGFNCHAYFDNLNVTLLDWSKIEDIEKLKKQIAML
jgi:hypothetical protein